MSVQSYCTNFSFIYYRVGCAVKCLMFDIFTVVTIHTNSTMNMALVLQVKTLAHFYLSIWCHHPEDHKKNTFGAEKFQFITAVHLSI